jgi:steroid delta-isomerase-like uncharacterized protein
MDPKVKIASDFMDALRKAEIEKLLSFLSEDVEIVGASGAHYGKLELERYFSHYMPPYRDVKTVPVGTYKVRDTVILESVLNGVHVKEYMGVPPSNKPFSMPTLNVFEVKNDEIAAWRQYQNIKILADLSIP